jgi:methylated-DNA-[protein]-cysteine S-methyltransferase
MMIYINFYVYPFCSIGIIEENKAVTHIYLRKSGRTKNNPQGYMEFSGNTQQRKVQETHIIKDAAVQITEYFDGKRKTFDLPLNPQGTDFQLRVWKALQNIPYGETRSYADIAAITGNPKAYRAVGMANHHNPIPIIIPCHRVIGANGSLTGYAGGLELKQRLLNLESEHLV